MSWFSKRPSVRFSLFGGAWYSEFAVCPMCGGFVHPKYHSEDDKYCSAPSKGTKHNHMHCRCGYEWTLPPRNPENVQ